MDIRTTYIQITKKGNMLFEVATGEGKSLMVVMLAIINYFLNDFSIDVLTSSPILAEREGEEQKKLYELMDCDCEGINKEKDEEVDIAEIAQKYEVLFCFDLFCVTCMYFYDQNKHTLKNKQKYSEFVFDFLLHLFF